MPRPARKRRLTQHQRLLGQWRGVTEAPEGMRPGKEMAHLIPETLAGLRLRNAFTEEEICSAWHQIVGPVLAPHTRPTGLRRGVLQVSVPQATAHYSIIGMKPMLLERLQERFGAAQVQDIHFKVGA